MEISILGLQKGLLIVECLLIDSHLVELSELQLTNSSCPIVTVWTFLILDNIVVHDIILTIHLVVRLRTL
jgi:hypothetical protein